jgi:hypothetical protein
MIVFRGDEDEVFVDCGRGDVVAEVGGPFVLGERLTLVACVQAHHGQAT